MSRCFPFPPPGYEKKPRITEQGDLLAKEKHKEKHKKEKDREKGEGRERKDRDRNKDKHKEKKERKEKHKDKNKDKERNKLPEDRRNEHGSEVHREDRLPYESHKSEEARNSKFTEELGRRIRDEEQGAKNHMVEDFSATTHRRIQITGASPATGTDKMVSDAIGTLQRKNEKLPPSYHQRTEGMQIATNTEKQKVAINEKVPEFNSAERRTKENLMQQKRNETVEKQRAAIIERPGLVQKKFESTYTVNSIQKERATSNNMASNTIGAATKTEGLASSISKRTESKLAVNSMQKERATNNMVSNTIGASKKTENLTSSVPRIESKFAVNSMQKERVTNNNMVSNTIGAATKRNDEMDLDRLVESITSIPRKIESAAAPRSLEKERVVFPNIIGTEQRQQVEKDADKKKEGKEKTRDKKAEDGDRNEKKRKEKDKDRHKEKKKEEKKREKGEDKHTKHDKLRENGTKDNITTTITRSINPKPLGEDQTVSLNNKTLAPRRIENINAASADGHNKKRKEFELNGVLHEPQHDERPNKMPRTIASSSHISVENGRPLEVIHVSPEKLGDINNSKVDKGFNNNRNHVNAKAEIQPSNLSRPSVPSVPPVAVDSSKSSRVQSRPPHPDTKYLNTTYSIPEVEEFPEFDDQEWLFSSAKPLSNTKADADEPPPQVWAQGLQIESADVFALPYVIPF